MSSGEDIRVSYYSAVLAKAICLKDGDLFTDLYDQIVRLVTKEQADLAVDRARDFSNLPLPTLVGKIKWLESHGVEPLKPSASQKLSVSKPATAKTSSSTEYLIEEQILYESDNSMSDETFSYYSSEKPNLQKLYERTMQQSPADRVEEFIDDNECEPIRSSAQQIPIVPGNNINNQGDNTYNRQDIGFTNNKPLTGNNSTLPPSTSNKTIVEPTDFIIELGEDPETAVDFGLPGFKQRNDSSFTGFSNIREKRYVDIEMKDLTSPSTHVIHSRQGNPETVLHPMQSADSEDDGSESNKKVKKKKKRKAKLPGLIDPQEEINMECEIDKLNFIGKGDEKSSKSSRNSRRKKFNEARKTCSSLECPNIQRSSVVDENVVSKPALEEKPKKRTIKRYQEEKEKGRVIGREQHYGFESSPLSKDESAHINPLNRKTYGTMPKKTEENKNSQLLNDETLNKILKDLGEGSKVLSEAKKKSREAKKDKKKNKKQKKSDKEKSKGENDVNVRNIEMQTFSTAMDDCERFDAKVEPGDEGEFVVQKKPRKSVNRTTQSGRSSPHEQEVRRGAMSPTNHVNINDMSDARAEQTYSDVMEEVGSSTIHVYDGEQWPTLPAALSANLPQSSMTNRCSTSSYASKLKSNLDSTGCSLASSSEDGASSSSSSSGGGGAAGRVTGRISPSNDIEFQLPDILSGVSSAVAATTKLIKSFSKISVKAESPMPSIQPACVNRKPAPIVEVARQLSKDISTVVITKLNTASDQVEPNPMLTDIAANNYSRELQQNDEMDKLKNPTDEKEDKHLPKDVVEIFENRWGLEFIMENPSMGVFGDFVQLDINDNTVLKQMASTADDNEGMGGNEAGKLIFECTFENSKLVEKPQLPTMFKKDEKNRYNMRCSENNIMPWNNPGMFDVDGAASLFLKEWDSVSKHATYYKDE
uniref:Titin homolog n=1 Tax=Phallusia mammillata TaxID=59560 RepID=A0A6F9DVA9_9ASCI|nr:titin homolog [Phallusia mammillata]